MTVAAPILEDPDFEELRSKEVVFKLFGLSISHSKAPLLQNYLFNKLNLNWRYELFDSDDIVAFKKHLYTEKSIGSAVTMPNKIVMASHVDYIDDGAKAVGAINTIYTRKEKGTGKTLYIGTNTDTIGIRDSFLYNAEDQVKKSQENNKPGLVFGGGGASRSAVYSLHTFLKCPQVYIINRYVSEVEALKESMLKGGFKGEIIHILRPEQARTLTPPNLIVCTVPDFVPKTEEEILARATLDVFINSEEKGAVLEMCYHPNPITRLYKDFETAGWEVIGGIEAMIYQGLAQQVLWTGYRIDQMPIRNVIDYVYNNVTL